MTNRIARTAAVAAVILAPNATRSNDHMRKPSSIPALAPVFLALVIALAACGGGSAPPSAATEETGAPAEATVTPTDAAESSDAGEDTGDTTTGDLGSMAACDLITSEEVSAAIGTEATEVEGDGDLGTYFCFYSGADGELLLGMTFVTEVVAQVYSSYAGDDSAESVSGIGDEAVWVASAQLLVARKGNNMLSIQAYVIDDEAGHRDAVTGLARIAAGRM